MTENNTNIIWKIAIEHTSVGLAHTRPNKLSSGHSTCLWYMAIPKEHAGWIYAHMLLHALLRLGDINNVDRNGLNFVS